MRRLDRYVISGFLPLVLFGIGAFAVILIGVDLLPKALKMVVRQDLPIGLVGRFFLYSLPGIFVLTVPMSVMFASLMSIGEMSSNGELLALRAGGIPFLRVSVPVIIMGFVFSVMTLGFNEFLTPWGSQEASRLVRAYRESGKAAKYLTFQIPQNGPPKRIFYVQRYSPATRRAEDVTVTEFDEGKFSRLYWADYAEWKGENWVLHGAKSKEKMGDTVEETELGRITIYVGRSPQQIHRLDRDPEDMSIAQLQQLLRQRRTMGLDYEPHIVEIIQLIHTRLALPWCALGFAMLGVALGVRPLRATAGVGFGVSLLVVFAYYVVFHALTLMGERGALSPFLTAWLPNVLLFATGLVLLRQSDT